MLEVTLSNAEIIQAALIGCMRTIRGKSFRDPSSSRKKQKKYSQWHLDIEGSCAEMAFAKARDLYWSGITMDTFKDGDVGEVQVRHTELAHGSLVLRPGDNDSSPFALVIGAAPTFMVVGWIYARDGKQKQWAQGKDGDEPYWRVPQSDLRRFKDD
jgi:hypothetical protein